MTKSNNSLPALAAVFCLLIAEAGLAREGGDPAPQQTAPQTQREALVDQLELATCAIAFGKPALENIIASGVFVSPDGLVLTAGHAVRGPDGKFRKPLFVFRNLPGRETTLAFHSAEVLHLIGDGQDSRDLALLKIRIKEDGIRPVHFDIGEIPATGSEMVMAGFPLVFDKIYQWPLFRYGRVAQDRYFLRGSKVIVLDMTSVSGFSGSPVVDLATGKLVAIVKGRATGNEASDYALATVVTPDDLAAP